MKSITTFGSLSILGLSLLMTSPCNGEPGEYRFEKIADSSCREFFCGPLTTFGVYPAINNRGEIAFHVNPDSSAYQKYVVVSTGKRFVPIADTSNPLIEDDNLFSDFEYLAINDTGTVLFRANLRATGRSGLLTGNGRTMS